MRARYESLVELSCERGDTHAHTLGGLTLGERRPRVVRLANDERLTGGLSEFVSQSQSPVAAALSCQGRKSLT